MSIQLVLVEPAGPLNVGSVARLCANFGLEGLRLVAPRCDPLGEEARRMAVHGIGLLERARTYPTLAAALADCGRVVATSGRGEGEPLPPSPPAEALRWLLGAERGGVTVLPSAPITPSATLTPSALVFGREDRGLSNDELLQAGRILQIATGPAYASLNLSHAVAVVLHELHGLRLQPLPPQQGNLLELPAPEHRTGAQDAVDRSPKSGATAGAEAPRPGEDKGAEPCPRGLLEAALADAEALLLEVGYLYPHTAHARMAKLRALLQRAQIRPQEVALLRGMVCQLRWASRRPCANGEGH
ncbi:MAG: TrmH family RNA methyltransferase [Synechococcaceae cyanobacterium ELA739]